MTPDKRLDLVSMGRCGVDLYSNDIGRPLREARSFNAYVGGCPTNVAVGTRRLGLRSALLTRIGAEPLGDFIVNFLQQEGVDLSAVVRDPLHLSGLVILGIEPPDRFPLTFYREQCADIHLSLDDLAAAPLEDTHLLFVSGTGFSRQPSAAATAAAVERAQAAGAQVMLDLDYRPTLWDDPRAFGPTLRRQVAAADLVVGTEEEIMAAAGEPDVEAAVARLLAVGRHLRALVVKRGQRGSTVFADGQRLDAAPFSVQVLNVLGAGDAYVSGFLYGVRHDWDWQRCARFGNATGAIVVTRHACANAMPSENEALTFVAQGGGFA
ncbi:MAG: 5-dehydro-2-deoxygluconokinase [Anaerolineales bacterium]|nr:5-dehydro-2-deoxygluconokinase [Anaerolineales bacterium]